METKKFDNILPGVSFTGPITINGPMFDIHDNQHIHFNSEKEITCNKEQEKNGLSNQEQPSSAQPDNEKLFQFIHPSIEVEDEWRIHNEVKRLVRRNGIQEICHYLRQLKKDNKVLLPQSPSIAYAELVRMGMPNKDGFNESTFRKYYNSR